VGNLEEEGGLGLEDSVEEGAALVGLDNQDRGASHNLGGWGEVLEGSWGV
jgi:hypothetical protein